MKPLLLSFFAVILCYSLFFDRGGNHKHVDEINNMIHTEAYDTRMSDSIPFYACRFLFAEEMGKFLPVRSLSQASN